MAEEEFTKNNWFLMNGNITPFDFSPVDNVQFKLEADADTSASITLRHNGLDASPIMFMVCIHVLLSFYFFPLLLIYFYYWVLFFYFRFRTIKRSFSC